MSSDREAYRSENLACPICKEPLVEAASSLPVSACRSCGGAWLGPEAAVHLLRDEQDDVTREIVAATERASRQPAPLEYGEGDRPCARCGQIMHRLDVGDIRLDCCPAHGTWFDRQEAKKCVMWLEAKRHPDDLEIAIGRVAVPFRLVGWLFSGWLKP